MKKKFFIFLISFYFISSYIVLPFKNQRSLSSLDKNKLEQSEILNHLLNLDLTVDIKIGSPSQTIPMSLSLVSSYIYITSNSIDIGLYDKQKSSSYKEISEALQDPSIFFEGFESQDTFIFGNNQKNKLEETPFILITDTIWENESRKGIIGLKMESYKQNKTLISLLKNKEIINSYYFYLKYTEEDQGIFVIGALPHEYSPNEYSYNDFRQVNGKDEYSVWSLYFDKMKYGEEEFDGLSFDFYYNFGFIQVNVYLKNEYLNHFFKKRIEQKLCEEYKVDKRYIYSCIDDDKKVKFSDLKDFHFYSASLEKDFVFDYKDLFISFNGRKYFLITYELNAMNNKLGKPFFKKYPIVLNPDNKQIGCYNKELVKNEEESFFKNKLFLYIAISVLIIILIVLIYLAIKKFGTKKRRINELDDTYEYIANEQNQNINPS